MDRKDMLKSAMSPLSKFLQPSTPSAKRGRASFVPESWDLHFTHNRKVAIGKNVFNVYEKGSEGPILLLVHGAGFSGLSWALFADAMTKLVICRCVAIDLRGHGDTVTENDEDLSAETLSADLANVAHSYLSESVNPPAVILIGHSLGGAVCVHAANKGLIPSLAGLVVIDVVEGTALESLSMMESLVRGRPSTFPSLENAIEWSFRTGHIKNPESARVSMVGQLKPIAADMTNELKPQPDIRQTVNTAQTILEDESLTADSSVSPPESESRLCWRIDLLKTQPFWLGWFTGLSEMFLHCPVPKRLLLAGMDRLDKDLTIGQMQGKFQMVVLPKSGHAVQEDQPVKVAESLATFMLRNKIVSSAGEFAP